MRAGSNATGDLDIDYGIGERIAFVQAPYQLFQFVTRLGQVNVNRFAGLFQALQMRLQIKEVSSVAGDDLIDAIGKLETAILNMDRGLR